MKKRVIVGGGREREREAKGEARNTRKKQKIKKEKRGGKIIIISTYMKRFFGNIINK